MQNPILAGLLFSIFVLLPHGASAGKPKSPFWAKVAANATLVAGNGAQSAHRAIAQPVGVYEVDFVREDLGDCAYVATTSDYWAGIVGTGFDSAIPYRVRVYTFASDGAPYDMPFHLVVNCPK
jgi:hypothetical protein